MLGVCAVNICANSQAAGFPERAVTLIVPYPAGGATDVIARMIAEKLPAIWGQQVVVSNRPGAGTTVAAEALATMRQLAALNALGERCAMAKMGFGVSLWEQKLHWQNRNM